MTTLKSLSQKFCLIQNKENGWFSTGGTDPKWRPNGKCWAIGQMKNHLQLFVHFCTILQGSRENGWHGEYNYQVRLPEAYKNVDKIWAVEFDVKESKFTDLWPIMPYLTEVVRKKNEERGYPQIQS